MADLVEEEASLSGCVIFNSLLDLCSLSFLACKKELKNSPNLESCCEDGKRWYMQASWYNASHITTPQNYLLLSLSQLVIKHFHCKSSRTILG
jgi:hypothetical protein